MENTKRDAAWIHRAGSPDGDLTKRVEDRLRGRLERKEFATADVEYVSNIRLRLGPGNPLEIGPERLDRIRRLCQLWETDIKIGQITSHRKFVGPVIVAVKRALMPVLKALMGETLKRQREFNAEVIHLLAQLSSSSSGRELAKRDGER